MKKVFLLCLLFAGSAQAALVRVGASTLGTIGIGAAVIDPVSDFAYFIDTGSLVLSSNPPFQNTTIQQVNLSNFSETATAFYSSTFTAPAAQIQNTAVIDPAGGFAYFTFGQSTGTIAKFHLPDFTQVSTAALSVSFGHLSCGLIDPTSSYAYFGTDTNPAQIVKIDLTNLAVISSITLASPAINLQSAVIDTINHFAYFGSSTTPGNVSKINLANFSFVKTLPFNGEGGAISAFLDATAGYLWFGTNDSPGRVVRILLNTFTEDVNLTLTLQANENKLSSVLYDPVSRKAYFGTFTSTGTVVRISAVAMARDTSLQFNTGESYLASAVMDADHYGYFGTLTNPGKVVKIDLIGGPPEITSGASPDQEVSVGQTASFSITASGRNLAYQWNRNGAPIPGATQTAYQLASAAIADDGVLFDCTVSNSSGSVTGGGTLLTVNPDIHAFPDPWRADRHAGLPLTFNNLLPGSNVEIFTLAAQWVRTIPANNGIATWDLKNNAGQNVASGYYFYYLKTADDRHTLRGKFAIIR